MSFTSLLTMFLLPLLALAAGSVLLAKLLYRRLYAPVEELVTSLGGDVGEKTNEFDYIRDQTSQISENWAAMWEKRPMSSTTSGTRLPRFPKRPASWTPICSAASCF